MSMIVQKYDTTEKNTYSTAKSVLVQLYDWELCWMVQE